MYIFSGCIIEMAMCVYHGLKLVYWWSGFELYLDIWLVVCMTYLPCQLDRAMRDKSIDHTQHCIAQSFLNQIEKWNPVEIFIFHYQLVLLDEKILLNIMFGWSYGFMINAVTPGEADWRIYASVNKNIIGLDNGLSPEHHQAIIFQLKTFSIKKKHLKMLSAKWWQFFLCPNVLNKTSLVILLWICYLAKLLNWSPTSAAYMRHWISTTLVQIMACHLFGAKPLSEPMMGYCQFDS